MASNEKSLEGGETSEDKNPSLTLDIEPHIASSELLPSTKDSTDDDGSQAISLKRNIRKHDSGICSDTSPLDQSSDESSSEQTPRRKSCKKQNIEDSPDSGHLDEAGSVASTQPATPTTFKDDKLPSSDGSSSHKDSSKSDLEELDDSGGDKLSSDSDPKTEDSDSEHDPTPKIPRPVNKWFVCREVLQRQYGHISHISSENFRRRCCGSLHMVQRLELMYKMEKHKGCVNTLHFNDSGNKLVSSSDDLQVVVWDWTISEPLLAYDSGHRSNVFQAKFLPHSGDTHIVSCARDGQVRIAELSMTGVCKRTRKLAFHHGPAHKLALENDSPHSFISCGEDAIVFEIDLRQNKSERLILCKEADKKVPLYSVYTNPKKSYEFAVGGRDQYIRIYDKRFIQEGRTCKKFCPHHLVNCDSKANVTCLVYNHNGTEILATYNDEDIYAFDSYHSDGSEYVHRYRGHRNSQTVKGVNYFGPKSEFIVSGSDCGHIYFWEHDTEHIVQFLHGDEGGVVNCLEPHPHCPVIATSGLDDDIKIWVPSCEHPPKLSGLKSVVRTRSNKDVCLDSDSEVCVRKMIICSNMKERSREHSHEENEMVDGQMLWFLMQQWNRSTRRFNRRNEDDEDSSGSNDSTNEDDDDSDATTQTIQCHQS